MFAEQKSDSALNLFAHRIRSFLRFYTQADTIYRIHSPFVFALAEAVLEDERWFYAFDDVEQVRQAMLSSDAHIEVADFGAGADGKYRLEPGIKMHPRIVRLRDVVRAASSSVQQSRQLFRLVHHLQPQNILELGTSVGVSTMYMASAARDVPVFTLEGCENCTKIASLNFETLQLHNVHVVPGAFDNTLLPTLKKLNTVDLVFFDGNHRQEPTLRYFETCLNFISLKSVFVFDDIYWSEDMTSAWLNIQQHSSVTTTVDFFDFGVALFSPVFKVKQHFRVLPTHWKIWQKYC